MKIIDKFLPLKYRALREYKRGLKKTTDIDLLKGNKKYIGLHKGERCFIIGNGPSLKTENLCLLKDETVFCVNDIYANEYYGEINPAYHFFMDAAYGKKLKDLILAIHSKNVYPTIVTGTDNFLTIKKEMSDIDALFIKSGFDIDYLKYIGIHIDGLLPYFCTVVQYAITVAIDMGYSEIYLLGCDCTGIQNFIQEKSGVSASTYGYDSKNVIKIDGAFEISCEHAFYEWYHIFKSYRILNDYATVLGVKITDLTSTGILDVLPKDNLVNVLAKKL